MASSHLNNAGSQPLDADGNKTGGGRAVAELAIVVGAPALDAPTARERARIVVPGGQRRDTCGQALDADGDDAADVARVVAELAVLVVAPALGRAAGERARVVPTHHDRGDTRGKSLDADGDVAVGGRTVAKQGAGTYAPALKSSSLADRARVVRPGGDDRPLCGDALAPPVAAAARAGGVDGRIGAAAVAAGTRRRVGAQRVDVHAGRCRRLVALDPRARFAGAGGGGASLRAVGIDAPVAALPGRAGARGRIGAQRRCVEARRRRRLGAGHAAAAAPVAAAHRAAGATAVGAFVSAVAVEPGAPGDGQDGDEENVVCAHSGILQACGGGAGARRRRWWPPSPRQRPAPKRCLASAVVAATRRVHLLCKPTFDLEGQRAFLGAKVAKNPHAVKPRRSGQAPRPMRTTG